MMNTLLVIQIHITDGSFSRMYLCSKASDILPKNRAIRFGLPGSRMVGWETLRSRTYSMQQAALFTTGVPTAVLLNTWRSTEGWELVECSCKLLVQQVPRLGDQQPCLSMMSSTNVREGSEAVALHDYREAITR